MLGTDQLEGDLPIQAFLQGAIDDSHPAAAESFTEMELTELFGKAFDIVLLGSMQQTRILEQLELRSQPIREIGVLPDGTLEGRLAIAARIGQTACHDLLDGIDTRVGLRFQGAMYSEETATAYHSNSPAPRPLLPSRIDHLPRFGTGFASWGWFH